MNYRHAFHAGNFADVVKHIVLALCIEHLKGKPTRFRLLDLYAGTGLYDLTSAPAERTGEWRGGVGRLYRDGSCEHDPLTEAAEALIAPWRKAVAAVNDGTTLARYPGSPEIARRLVRETDPLVFNELHPDDFDTLSLRFGRDKRVRLLCDDAWAVAKAQLPPPERRGLVLVDPPYEVADEVPRLLAGLAEMHRRFATGVYCVWYPVKAQADANALARRAQALSIPKTLRVELTVRPAVSGDRLNGSGLLVVNPPWKLEADLKLILPELGNRLADPQARSPGGSRLEWLTTEAGAVNAPSGTATRERR